MHATTIELRGPGHLRDRRRIRPGRVSGRNKSWSLKIGFVLSSEEVWRRPSLVPRLVRIGKSWDGLEILLERVASWPEDAQEEFVRSVANIESKHTGVYRLSEDERAAVRRGLSV